MTASMYCKPVILFPLKWYDYTCNKTRRMITYLWTKYISNSLIIEVRGVTQLLLKAIQTVSCAMKSPNIYV